MFTGIRRGSIMSGVLDLLSGAHVRPRRVLRLVRLHALLLAQPVAGAGVVAEAAADAGEV